MYELRLTATQDNWRLLMTRKADKAFLVFQGKIFQRDHDTCQFCGFHSKVEQEVINLDGNYRNNKLSNLVTACPFCAQCLFIESIGESDFGGGTLIYAQEMSQTQINALCHVLFASIVNNTSYADQAHNIYRGLKLRAQLVEKYLGEGMSKPSLLGRMIIDANLVRVTRLNDKLIQPLRLLPSASYFIPQIKNWCAEAVAAMKGKT
ncbi:MAG: type IV secretion protein IcmJ [Gammaproteobacteria bacterium RIFOXYB2_FULL_38_6]|nr:MAG: type IV secretion protein IcmJ [Gammaproteobacteria bacterium RIFOXYB2_FULL_38_6]